MLHRLLGLLQDDLAVDLGTANTLIALPGEGLVLNEPSVVAVERATRRVLSGGRAVGHLARQMQGRTPDSIRVVRPLRCGVVADFALCEAMLRHFLHKVQRRRFALGPRVVVAVPQDVTPVEKQALYNSAHRAAAREVYTIAKARAAAIGVGLPVNEPVASMVCDIGSGTTEVAVLTLGDIASSQSIRVGGDAMDQALAESLRRNDSLRVGPATAERLRIELGSAMPLEQEISCEISGIDTVSGLPRKAVVTSEEVREALGDSLEAIVEAIRATIDGCPPDLAADLADQGLVLCGGGALLRHLDRYVTERTGLPARVAADPLAAVVQGTLLCLEQFDHWRPRMESSDDDF